MSNLYSSSGVICGTVVKKFKLHWSLLTLDLSNDLEAESQLPSKLKAASRPERSLFVLSLI